MTEIKGPLQFNEFSTTTDQEWLEKIKKDLKGKDFQETLVHENFEGISIQPNYHPEKITVPAQNIGSVPYLRGWKKDNYWETRVLLSEKDGKKLNENIIFNLQNGASSIGLPEGPTKWNQVFEDVQLDVISIDFERLNSEESEELQAYIKECQYDKTQIQGWFRRDFVTSENITSIDDFIQQWDDYSNFRPIKISSFGEAQAGANKVHQLGIMLSKMNAVVANSNASVDQISSALICEMVSDTQLFMEIAKQRAFRVLYAHFIEQYAPGHECSKTVKVHAQTAFWNFSQKDIYTNLLRNTIAASGAVLGGVDVLTVTPFDINNSDSSFVQRMSRNISSILKDESFFSRVADPAGGAYYVEYLTQELIDKSWAFFQEIEAKGGYFEAKNFIDKTIQADQSQLKAYFEKGGTLVGINMFQPEESEGKIQQQTIAATLEG